MNSFTVEYEGLRPMNEFGYWHYHTDQKGLPDGGMSISVELLNKYAADKVREALDRIEGQQGAIEMWQVITETRKEIE